MFNLRASLLPLLLIALIAAPVASSAATRQDTASDPVLAAMQAELAREQAQLILPGMLKPYFIE